MINYWMSSSMILYVVCVCVLSVCIVHKTGLVDNIVQIGR